MNKGNGNDSKKRKREAKPTTSGAPAPKKPKTSHPAPPPPISKSKDSGQASSSSSSKKSAGNHPQSPVISQFSMEHLDIRAAAPTPKASGPAAASAAAPPAAPEVPITRAQLAYTADHLQLDGLSIAQSATYNTGSKASNFLKWFLAPLSPQQFFEQYWEKRVFALKRKEWKALAQKAAKDGSTTAKNSYYEGWWSTQVIKNLVNTGTMRYTEDLDVTLYKNAKRFTLNPQGNDVVDSDLIWDLVDNQKCSVRVLRPQQYSTRVSSMLALLEEAFGQGFGANSYLTPAGSQGFSPHWDDVEAFVLQLEGRKQWRIHGPRESSEVLSRYSSKNFQPGELGEPIMTVWLEEGDLMYFPRGTIHQAISDPNTHSLHLTVSTSQNYAWIDFFEKAIPMALQQATEELLPLRESLPIHYEKYMGLMFSQDKSEKRKEFLAKATAMAEQIFNNYLVNSIDDAADQMACKFLYDRQPPLAMLSMKEIGLSEDDWNEEIGLPQPLLAANDVDMVEDEASEEEEAEHKASGDEAADGNASPPADDEDEAGDEITVTTGVKLITASAVRLVAGGNEGDEDVVSLYHAVANTNVYHETPETKIRLPIDFAEAIEALYRAYPKFTKVGDLPLETDEEKVELAKLLLDNQILMIE